MQLRITAASKNPLLIPIKDASKAESQIVSIRQVGHSTNICFSYEIMI